MTRTSTGAGAPSWLLLILTLPGRQPAVRMRVWRSLKLAGVGVLRDGVYVAPERPGLRALLASQADAVLAAGGTAHLLDASMRNADFAALFDRADEYRQLLDALGRAARTARSTDPARSARAAERLRREFEAIVARDFFPEATQARVRRAVDEFIAASARRLSPDEPHAGSRRIRRLDRREYQGRTWATRKRPWVDRLASAWLIKRCIDPAASFRWLDRPSTRLGRAIGFDFDGAAFSHVEDKVTYEVLMHSFGLEHDPGVQQLAAIVHYLDVGGVPVPEASAIETVLRGMRERATGDDRFLAEAMVLFDDLYAGCANAAAAS